MADPTSRSAWHRRASRPVMGWMLALIVLAMVHRWVPQSRWLLVHMVTLGLLTTSVMIWAQHFADGLLKTRADESLRRRQVMRIRILTLAIIVTAVGMVGAWPLVTTVGAIGVAAMMSWFALSLVRQMRSALPSRFASVVRGYAIAAIMLILGAGFGAALAFSPAPLWQGRLLLAHQSANLLGFIATTALITLVTLAPTVMHVKVPPRLEATLTTTQIVVPGGATVSILGALAGIPLISAIGVAAVAGMAAWVLLALVPAGRRARWQTLPLYPPLAMMCALGWLTGTLAVVAITLVRVELDGGTEMAAADLQSFTVPFVGGFGLQLLLGAMSHLMPTVMGGGPRAVRASLAELSRGAVLRVVLFNLSLLIYLVADGSWTRVLASLVAAGTMVAFLPLMIRGVRASLRARREGPVAVGMPSGPGSTPAQRSAAQRPTIDRRSVGTGAAIGVAGALGVLAAGTALDHRGGSTGGGGGAVAPSGRTVRADVAATADMRFVPDTVRAQPGDRVVITVRNDDESTDHDLLLSTGETTGRIAPGASDELTIASVQATTEGWCTIVGHRSMGMVLTVEVTGSGSAAQTTQAGAGGAAATPEAIDLTQAPGADFTTRDARLPEKATGTIDLTVTSALQEVAPGRRMQAMTYNGRVMGPVLRGKLGAPLTVHLHNQADMGHSLDLHAGTVSPDPYMRTIAPGASLDYPIRTDHAGIWLYHCSTMPMSVHLASGMFGAVVVPPAGLKTVDHEWVIVQSEGYLGPDGSEVDADAIRAERPAAILWNGHANQYVHDPLRARAGERVRIWVLAAGPSRGMSFHVVGGVFDTVFKEGSYRLRADQADGGGSQALDLSAAQGGFVELTFAEAGTYTAVSHSFVDMERGARALIVVE